MFTWATSGRPNSKNRGACSPWRHRRRRAVVGKEALERHDGVETRFRGRGEDGSSPTGLSMAVLEGIFESASAGWTASRASRQGGRCVMRGRCKAHGGDGLLGGCRRWLTAVRPSTQRIGYHIGLPRMIVDSKIIILDKLQPSSLLKIQVWQHEDVPQTPVIRIQFTSLSHKVVPPNFESVNYNGSLQS
jgi:hypothetical protein